MQSLPAQKWGKSHNAVTLDLNNSNIAEAPSGYHSATLANTYQNIPGGQNEHTVKIKFVSGNTILIGFSKTYVDENLQNQNYTCFYRSNGSGVYVNGTSGETRAISYDPG